MYLYIHIIFLSLVMLHPRKKQKKEERLRAKRARLGLPMHDAGSKPVEAIDNRCVRDA